MVHEALRRTLGPGGVFVDVGSNLGYTALLAAGIVGPQGRVIALDAQRECALATIASTTSESISTFIIGNLRRFSAAMSSKSERNTSVTRTTGW